jgi:hypothetical protein
MYMSIPNLRARQLYVITGNLLRANFFSYSDTMLDIVCYLIYIYVEH